RYISPKLNDEGTNTLRLKRMVRKAKIHKTATMGMIAAGITIAVVVRKYFKYSGLAELFNENNE
ncbi:hypothetical protein LJB90_04170, partial [Eubacteriales bacterium OttesenSCG-928-G02]|nr:hypothetical protein [Eubacteriales bacterium OttesenSCG-928-G02]